MRVALIISRIDQLGPIIVVQNLVNSLRFCDDLSLKVFYIDKKIKAGIKMNVPVERLNWRKFSFADFDIVHTNGIRPDLFAYLNRGKIKCHISTIHNIVFDEFRFTYNKFVALLFGNIWLNIWRRADKLVCVSGTLKMYYVKWLSPDKLHVIYNGISDPEKSFIPDKKIIDSIDRFHAEGLKVLGFAGILTKRKGVDQILKLLSLKKEYALVIIGDGKEKAGLIRKAEKSGISDRCIFGGFKENAVSYFKYFDLFVMPSRSEGFGLALVEAVQQNTPVICSDIDVFKELFSEEEVTFFKSDDLSSLSKALDTAKETGKIKSKVAYARYLDNYKSDLMAQRYYEIYRSA